LSLALSSWCRLGEVVPDLLALGLDGLRRRDAVLHQALGEELGDPLLALDPEYISGCV
jgi:hypothetical protein